LHLSTVRECNKLPAMFTLGVAADEGFNSQFQG